MSDTDYVSLIDLDTVLDTRLGVLANLNLEAFRDVINNRGYFTRKDDDLSKLTDKITRGEWFEAWDNRTADVLPESIRTNMVRVIAEHFSDIVYARDSTNDTTIGDLKLKINLYPYDGLTDKEKEGIVNIFGFFFPVMADDGISTCYIHPSYLTPTYLRENFSLVSMYDLPTWNREVFRNKPYDGPTASMVTVMAPGLVERDSLPDETLMAEFGGSYDKLFGMAEYTISPIIRLAIQDIASYCIVNTELVQVRNNYEPSHSLQEGEVAIDEVVLTTTPKETT